MIWYHNHPDLQCFIDIGNFEYDILDKNDVLEGIILYIVFDSNTGNNWYVGKPILPIIKYGRLATEEDLIKLNKFLTFQ